MRVRFGRSCAVLAVLVAVSGASVHAGTTIQDPLKIVEKTDEFLGEVPFHEALRCGDVAEYEISTCGMQFNDAENDASSCPPEKTRSEVLTCLADRVEIEYVSHTGEVEKEWILKSTYDLYRGNMFRYMLANTFGAKANLFLNQSKGHPKDYIEITGYSAGKYQVGSQTFDSLEVSFVIQAYAEDAGRHVAFPMAIALLKGSSLIAQQAYWDLLPGTSDRPFMRLIRTERQ